MKSIEYRIVCPVQETEGFTIRLCMNCKHLQMEISEKTNVSCRKNRSTEHKQGFQGAFWSGLIGLDDRVTVEAKEESKERR